MNKAEFRVFGGGLVPVKTRLFSVCMNLQVQNHLTDKWHY